MPAPSSSRPKRSAAVSTSRKFTLEQANKALPLVKRIVADIVRTHGQAVAVKQSLDQALAREKAALQNQLDDAVDRLSALVDELGEVGVELKDYESGLVDFVGRHEGRDVYLCWKLGEEKVLFWHELGAG